MFVRLCGWVGGVLWVGGGGQYTLLQLQHDQLRLRGSTDDLGERDGLHPRLSFFWVTEQRSHHGRVPGKVHVAVHMRRRTDIYAFFRGICNNSGPRLYQHGQFEHWEQSSSH